MDENDRLNELMNERQIGRLTTRETQTDIYMSDKQIEKQIDGRQKYRGTDRQIER